MLTRTLCILTLILCLATSGCLSSRYADRNSSDEMRKSKVAIDQLNEQVTALNKEMDTLKKELQQIKEEKQKEVAGVGAENVSPSDQTGIARETAVASVPEPEKKDTIQEIDIVKKEEITKAPEAQQSVSQKEVTRKLLRMKVLSGNGRLSVARDMSTKIIRMGYKIEDIGLASRTDYKATTIYFAPEYRKEAEGLATSLGGEAITKPITWTSVFHIIVVAVP